MKFGKISEVPFERQNKEKHGPTISYKEACELAGRSSLTSIIAIRDDAPKAKVKTRSRNCANTYYDKKEMVAWLKKLKSEGLIK